MSSKVASWVGDNLGTSVEGRLHWGGIAFGALYAWIYHEQLCQSPHQNNKRLGI